MDENGTNLQPEHLGASELGTKEHWETTYVRELENFSSDPSDEGTIWFEDVGAEEKIAEFVIHTLDLVSANGLAEPQLHCKQRKDATIPRARILDLGTGNGHLLFAIREEGGQEMWKDVEMIGVDYSPSSIELAKRILRRRKTVETKEIEGEASECDAVETPLDQSSEEVGNSSETDGMKFMIWDLLSDDPNDLNLMEGFDFVLDKGTFDAISLSQEPLQHHSNRRACEVYPEKAISLVKPGGYFLITSCNWTEEELRQWFEGPSSFRLFSTIEYPTFTFGGNKGQSVSSVCFQRVRSDKSS